MRRVVLSLLSIVVALALGTGGCSRGPVEVASFPLNGDQDIIDRGAENVAFDREESADGGGSLRAEAARPAPCGCTSCPARAAWRDASSS